MFQIESHSETLSGGRASQGAFLIKTAFQTTRDRSIECAGREVGHHGIAWKTFHLKACSPQTRRESSTELPAFNELIRKCTTQN